MTCPSFGITGILCTTLLKHRSRSSTSQNNINWPKTITWSFWSSLQQFLSNQSSLRKSCFTETQRRSTSRPTSIGMKEENFWRPTSLSILELTSQLGKYRVDWPEDQSMLILVGTKQGWRSAAIDLSICQRRPSVCPFWMIANMDSALGIRRLDCLSWRPLSSLGRRRTRKTINSFILCFATRSHSLSLTCSRRRTNSTRLYGQQWLTNQRPSRLL